MNRIMNPTMKHTTVRGLWGAACIITLAIQPFTASPAAAVTTVPVLWSAGGLSAGVDSAGQSARMASDASGNIAIVSGPANARDLAVTSYTAGGTLRWRRTITPALGTCVGDWVVAAPNGDFIAIGHNEDSHGRPIQSTMVRYDTGGALLWRVDFSSGFYPVVGRLVVDSAGSAYLAWSATGSGLFVQKYSPSGALLWSQGSSTGGGYAIATSLALSPDGADVVATGDVSGGALWITAAFNTTTGVCRWEVAVPEGLANLDVVVDATRVYVTGEGVTDPGTPAMRYWLTVVAYDRATGARLWRTDANAPTCCAIGVRMALAPDGSLVVAGKTSSGGYFDWWTVAFNTNGAVRWQARRDEAISGDEIPAAVFVLADGTTVVSGTGGPVIRDILGNSYMQGVTAGYSSNGTLLWEAFSRLPTVWATALPNGNVCATGGYDALITCWRVSSTPTPTPAPTPTPINISGTISYCSNPVPGPVPDVTLTLTGTMSGSTLSDGSGNYQFSSLVAGGNYVVLPTKGALTPGSTGIDTVDAIATQRHFLNILLLPGGCQRDAADVNGDTAIDTVDVIAMQRFYLGQSTGIANTGKYKFTPVDHFYAGINSNQTGQNYDTLIFGDVVTGFVHRPEGPSQDVAVDDMSGGEVPATVATVALPEVAVAQAKSNFIAAVTTTAIEAKNKLVGFQGDFTFDERVVTFQSEPVQKAGITGGNWNVSGNVLPGAGPIRTLRISAYSNDFTPLSGSGTLFELRMTRVSKAAHGAPLLWAAPPDHFIFIDADLNAQKPGNASPGSVAPSGER